MSKVVELINTALDDVKKFAAPLSEEDRINLLLNIEKVRCKYVHAAESEKILLESEIIHCSECRHGQQVGDLGVVCEYGCEEYRPFDHFCAWGERRSFEDDGDE